MVIVDCCICEIFVSFSDVLVQYLFLCQNELTCIFTFMLIIDGHTVTLIPDNNNQAAKWDATRDAYLVEQLLYHQSIGRRPQSVWSKEAWRETRAAFNLKFSTSYNVKVFKNRLTKLKDQHNTIRELIGVNGFGWDDHYHMVTAENTVWDEYILVYSSVLFLLVF